MKTQAGPPLLTLRTLLLALCAAGLLLYWYHFGDPWPAPRTPGPPRPPSAASAAPPKPSARGELQRLGGDPPPLPGRWAHFRGPTYTGVAAEPPTPLNLDWARRPPRTLWAVQAGEGYAGAAVWDGRVYLLDYDAQARRDVLRCLALADGKDLWRYAYAADVKRNHGHSRATPSVSEELVVTVGPLGHVTALDPRTGELRWAMDLVHRFGAQIPAWYSGQSPLILGDQVVLASGGQVLLLSMDAATGRVRWQSANPRRWAMTHSSVIPAQVQGRSMLVYAASGGVVGVDPGTGALLWEHTGWHVPMANVPTPVFLPPDRLFFTGGYGAGSRMLQVVAAGGALSVRELWSAPAHRFGAHVQTPVLLDDMLYGVGQDQQLTCLDASGRVRWKSGNEAKYGLAPHLAVAGHLLALTAQGVLRLVRATPTGYTPLGELQVLPGQDPMGPMALAAGRLILRDLTEVKCLDLSGG